MSAPVMSAAPPRIMYASDVRSGRAAAAGAAGAAASALATGRRGEITAALMIGTPSATLVSMS
jgi:hypothetical protein